MKARSMAPQQHKIRNLKVDVRAPWASSSQEIHNRIQRLVGASFWEALGKKIDAFIAPNCLLKIGDIQLDLGDIGQEALDEVFLARLEEQLILAIQRHLEEVELLDATWALAPEVQGDLQVMEFYLVHGGLPWWHKAPALDKAFDPARKLAGLLRDSGPVLLEMLRRHTQDLRFLARLVQTLGTRLRLALLKLLAGASASSLMPPLQNMEAAARQASPSTTSPSNASQHVWVLALHHLLSSQGQPIEDGTLIQQIRQDLALQFPQAGFAPLAGEQTPWTDITATDEPAAEMSGFSENLDVQIKALTEWLSSVTGAAHLYDAGPSAWANLSPQALVQTLRQLPWKSRQLQGWWRSRTTLQLEPLIQALAGASYARLETVRAEWRAIMAHLSIATVAVQRFERHLLGQLLELLLSSSMHDLATAGKTSARFRWQSTWDRPGLLTHDLAAWLQAGKIAPLSQDVDSPRGEIEQIVDESVTFPPDQQYPDAPETGISPIEFTPSPPSPKLQPTSDESPEVFEKPMHAVPLIRQTSLQNPAHAPFSLDPQLHSSPLHATSIAGAGFQPAEAHALFESDALLELLVEQLLRAWPATMQDSPQVWMEAIAKTLQSRLLHYPWHLIIPKVMARWMAQQHPTKTKATPKAASQQLKVGSEVAQSPPSETPPLEVLESSPPITERTHSPETVKVTADAPIDTLQNSHSPEAFTPETRAWTAAWEAILQEVSADASAYLLAAKPLEAGALAALLLSLHEGQVDAAAVTDVLGKWVDEPPFTRQLAGLDAKQRVKLLSVLAPGYRTWILQLETALGKLPAPLATEVLVSFWGAIWPMLLQRPAAQLSPFVLMLAVVGSHRAALLQALRAGVWEPTLPLLRAFIVEAEAAPKYTILQQFQRWLQAIPAFALPQFDAMSITTDAMAEYEDSTTEEQVQALLAAVAAQTDNTAAEVRQILIQTADAGKGSLHDTLTGLLAVSTWVPKPVSPTQTAAPTMAHLQALLTSARHRPAEWPPLAFMLGIWGLETPFFATAAALPDQHKKQLVAHLAPGYAKFVADLVEDVALLSDSLALQHGLERIPKIKLWEAALRLLLTHLPATPIQVWLMQGLLAEFAASPPQLAAAIQALLRQLRLGRSLAALVQTITRPVSAVGDDDLKRFLLQGQLPLDMEAAQLRTRLLDMALQFPVATSAFLRALGAAPVVAHALRLLLPTEEFCQLAAALGLFQYRLLLTLCLEADRLGKVDAGLSRFGTAYREALMILAIAQGPTISTADLAMRALYVAAKALQIPLAELLGRILKIAAEGASGIATLAHVVDSVAQRLRLPVLDIAPSAREAASEQPFAEDTPLLAIDLLEAAATQLQLALQGKGEFPAPEMFAPVLRQHPALVDAVLQVLKRKQALRARLVQALTPETMRLLLLRRYGYAAELAHDLVLVMGRHAELLSKPRTVMAIWQMLLSSGLLRQVDPERIHLHWISTLPRLTAEQVQQLQELVQLLSPLFRHARSQSLLKSALNKVQASPASAPIPTPAQGSATTSTTQTPWQMPTDTLAEYAVSNAGIVLLWPFFDRYFDALGLLKKGKFRGMKARERAVFMLQYLCKGETRPAEEALVLPKVLCGLDPADLLQTSSIRPKQAEKELTESLLHAAVSYWRTLGDTSTATFQETFLDRPGQLKLKERQFYVEVEHRSYDVLLRTLPWGLNPVNLSWMRKIMEVKWD